MGRRLTLTAPPDPLEHELQVDCTKMLAIVLQPSVQWTAIDHAHSLDRRIGRNGRPIGLLEAQKRVARGIKPGVTDYLFWHGGYGFAIELKRDADQKLSDAQKLFVQGLLNALIPVKVCWTKDQVFATVVAWGLTRASVQMHTGTLREVGALV